MQRKRDLEIERFLEERSPKREKLVREMEESNGKGGGGGSARARSAVVVKRPKAGKINRPQ
jgi:hypothetical protein